MNMKFLPLGLLTSTRSYRQESYLAVAVRLCEFSVTFSRGSPGCLHLVFDVFTASEFVCQKCVEVEV